MLKEFGELLMDNTPLKVQNLALETKNLKWKEWWQTIQYIIHKGANSIKHGINVLMNKVTNYNYKCIESDFKCWEFKFN